MHTDVRAQRAKQIKGIATLLKKEDSTIPLQQTIFHLNTSPNLLIFTAVVYRPKKCLCKMDLDITSNVKQNAWPTSFYKIKHVTNKRKSFKKNAQAV